MKPQWKDKKGIWKDKKGITSSTIKIGHFHLYIHHYIGYGNEWFASCDGLFDMISLFGNDIDSLKEQSLQKLKSILLEAIEDFPI